MSELVLIFPVMALTLIVLAWILALFRKWLIQRDRLDAASSIVHAPTAPATRAARSGVAPEPATREPMRSAA